MKKGMKIGGRHSWKYKTDKWNEVKIAPRKWKFVYYQNKTRLGRNAPKGSGFPQGGKLHWKITADQYAVKTGPNTYKLIMRGIKRQAGWKKKHDRKWR